MTNRLTAVDVDHRDQMDGTSDNRTSCGLLKRPAMNANRPPASALARLPRQEARLLCLFVCRRRLKSDNEFVGTAVGLLPPQLHGVDHQGLLAGSGLASEPLCPSALIPALSPGFMREERVSARICLQASSPAWWCESLSFNLMGGNCQATK